MLRNELHVDPQEAQEVVKLAARQHATPLSEGPTVGGLAEALSLPPEEIERLLAEVRLRQMPVQPVVPVASPARQFGDRSAALSAGIVLALVVVLSGVGFGAYWLTHQPVQPPVAPDAPFSIDTGDGNKVEIGKHGIKVRSGPGAGSVTTTAPPVSSVLPESIGIDEKEVEAKVMKETIDRMKAEGERIQKLAPEDRAAPQADLEQAQADFKKSFPNAKSGD